MKRIQNTPSSPQVSRIVWVAIGLVVVVAVGVGVAVFAGRSEDESTRSDATATGVDSVARRASLPVVEVYKSPTCGCCSKWVEHLQASGFTVRTTHRDDLTTFKTEHGVPRRVQSCHTALVDGYVLEGHVPATDVERLLKERPAIAGLAVAGMPIGSPGMEVPGVKPQPYDVIAFEKGGGTRVFAAHR